jgi:hypothetical protein
MLTIKSWCLSNNLSEEELNDLHNSIVKAVASVSEIGVNNESDMLNLFPSDMMNYGLGSEVVIEITGFPRKIDCGKSVRDKLAKAVGVAVKKNIREATLVTCRVYSPDYEAGRWQGICA